MHIGFFACFQGKSLERSRFLFIIQAHVVLKPLVSLIGRLVACSARTEQTDRQTNYCNPRCVCVLRVNKDKLLSHIQTSATQFIFE